jgi:hypothetical protein
MIFYVKDQNAIHIAYTRSSVTLPGSVGYIQRGSPRKQELLSTCPGSSEQVALIRYALRDRWISDFWFIGPGIVKEIAGWPVDWRSLISERGELPIIPISRRKYSNSRSSCVACNETINQGEEIAKIAASWVHVSCAEFPAKPQATFSTCALCGGTIFPGEKYGRAVKHKVCVDKASES